MKRFVIDCSVVMAWCFEDETDRYADLVLDLLIDSEAMVPSVSPVRGCKRFTCSSAEKGYERQTQHSLSSCSVNYLSSLIKKPLIVH